jgi:ubiquitin-protein ligase
MSFNDGRRKRHTKTSKKEDGLLLSTPAPHNSLQKLIRDCLTPEYNGLVAPNGRKGKNRPYTNTTVPHLYSSPPRIPFSLQEEREQALRDYKVTIEYKHLKSHAPGGVYLVPSMDNLRHFFGVVFVRRGPFTNGIFKFSLQLPPKYNDTNMWPHIVFSSRVFNPYVNEKTGALDIQSAYPTWDPSRHYLVTVLTYLKKIFYSKNFTDARANPQARELAETDPEAYRKKVDECVRESQKNVYINEKGSTAQFTEEQVSHRVLRDLLKHHISNESQVTKQAVLTQVEKARKV